MPDWNELFKEPANRLDVAEPFAVDLVEALPPRSRVLDLGSGAGRHLALFASREILAVGFDSAREGLAASRARLRGLGETARLVRGDFRRPLPFIDRAFDAVLAVKSVNHARTEEVAAGFAEMERVLKPGGKLWGVVIADSDARCGDGIRIDARTYVHDRPPEEGVVHHYFGEAELRRLLARFEFLDLFLVERVVEPTEPIFGGYRFRPGVAPVFRHWCFRAIR